LIYNTVQKFEIGKTLVRSHLC